MDTTTKNTSLEKTLLNPDTYTTSLELNALMKHQHHHSLSFLHVNCRSISSKIYDLSLLIFNSKAHILAVTETWLQDNNSDSVSIPGYNFVCKNRDGKRGGGVGFLQAKQSNIFCLTIYIVISLFPRLSFY